MVIALRIYANKHRHEKRNSLLDQPVAEGEKTVPSVQFDFIALFSIILYCIEMNGTDSYKTLGVAEWKSETNTVSIGVEL